MKFKSYCLYQSLIYIDFKKLIHNECVTGLKIDRLETEYFRETKGGGKEAHISVCMYKIETFLRKWISRIISRDHLQHSEGKEQRKRTAKL